MLRNATVAALALCAGLPMTSTAQQPCEHQHEDTCFHGVGVGCGKAAMMSRRLAAGQTQEDEGLQALAEAFSATDLLHANIDLEIFPATVTLSGTCTLTVKALQPISEFTFRLRNNFTITSATVNGATPVTVANPSTTTRIATLDRVYAANETFTLTIVYNGPAVSRGFGSIEFQTTPVGDPIIATLSEAFYAYTWWPAKDADVGQPGDMSDKATFQLAITAPDNLTSVANGMLQGVDVLSGARKRYRWSTTYPQAVYLAAFGSSVYDHYTIPWTIPGGGGATMPYDVYIFPGDNNASNRAQWDLSLPALDVFSNLFGMYPFVNEKYGIYQFPFSGGMEHQTMTGMGVFLDFVTVHELAHQWWGDDVTCKTWNDIWLNEGFATYCEALWEEFKPGSSGTPALHAAMAGRRPGAVSGSVYRYDTSSNNPIFSGTYSYRKGGWVLHMLRHVLGDAQFFGALNAYRAQFTGSAATTEDFKNSVEASTGKELDTFFQQWVYAGGAPGYAAGFQPITVNGKHYAKVRLRQTQTDVNFGVGGLFVMPVDLRLDTGTGSVTRTVNDDAMSDHFVLAAPAPVTGLTVDEFNWILATEKLSEAYVPGPPVVVETIPAPGSNTAFTSSPTFVDVFFSDNVTAPSGAFTVSGPSGSVPFTHAYSAGLQRSRLTFAAALPAGTYTVTIGPAVTTAAGALDGEVVAATLPSGDGAAGGPAVITFTIDPPTCAADFNQDGNLDPDDLGDYINCYFAVPPCDQADFNSDTNTDPDDLGDFINAYFAGCA